MTIYDFSMASWMEVTGVDTSMCYRANILQEMGYDVKLVISPSLDIRDMRIFQNMGFSAEQFLAVQQSFTDVTSVVPAIDIGEQLDRLRDILHYTQTEERENSLLLISEGQIVAEMSLTKDRDRFYAVCYYLRGTHVRRDYYSDVLYASDIFESVESDNGILAVKTKKIFYNRDGTIALTQIFRHGQEYNILSDGRCLNHQQLMNLFVDRMGFSSEDVVIMDRPGVEFAPGAIFTCSDRIHIVAVMHSEHFMQEGLTVEGEALNREYWYWFKYSHHIHTMIVSTEEQRNSLAEALRYYGCAVPDIRVIPVMGVKQPYYPDEHRKPKSIICVTRLCSRKKVDWTIYAAMKAHEADQGITLDIYGSGDGGYTEYLKRLIEENGASAYIRLMGRCLDVAERYKDYELYLTTSLWETFGITLLEAADSGLALVGLDVRYGNQTFIRNGYNGYRVPYDPGHLYEPCPPEIDMLAKKILEIFFDRERLEEFSRHSYEIAEEYATDRIKEKWQELVAGV